MLRRSASGVVLALVTLVAAPAFAQLNGENLLGDTGVKNGSQAAPGIYSAFLYYRYGTDVIKDKNGNERTADPGQPGSETLNAFMGIFIYVSKTKVLGANYGMMAAVPSANAALEAPAFGFQDEIDTGAADLYLMPLQLGWHRPRADVVTAFALFAPTGRYEAGSDNNIGKGMWSYELSAGTTLYLDRQKSVSVSTSGFWEIHTKKSGTGDVSVGPATLKGVKVGQLLTLEGGVGKSFLEGAASVGMAYYAQYKLTNDQFDIPANLPGGALIGKHRVWGFGPDVTIPVATKTKLISFVNVRYLWEAGARTKTEGQSLVVTATFPLPSITIPPRK
jgi:hypothetical protein